MSREIIYSDNDIALLSPRHARSRSRPRSFVTREYDDTYISTSPSRGRYTIVPGDSRPVERIRAHERWLRPDSRRSDEVDLIVVDPKSPRHLIQDHHHHHHSSHSHSHSHRHRHSHSHSHERPRRWSSNTTDALIVAERPRSATREILVEREPVPVERRILVGSAYPRQQLVYRPRSRSRSRGRGREEGGIEVLDNNTVHVRSMSRRRHRPDTTTIVRRGNEEVAYGDNKVIVRKASRRGSDPGGRPIEMVRRGRGQSRTRVRREEEVVDEVDIKREIRPTRRLLDTDPFVSYIPADNRTTRSLSRRRSVVDTHGPVHVIPPPESVFSDTTIRS